MVETFHFINYPVATYCLSSGQAGLRTIDELEKLTDLIHYIKNSGEKTVNLGLRMPIQWVPLLGEDCQMIELKTLKEERLYPHILTAGEGVDNTMYALNDLVDFYYFLNRPHLDSTVTPYRYCLEIGNLAFRLEWNSEEK